MITLRSPSGRKVQVQQWSHVSRAYEAEKIGDEWTIEHKGGSISVADYMNSNDTTEGLDEFQMPETFRVKDYKQSLTAGGKAKRAFKCPQCERSLVSTEEQYDVCPNCGASIEFDVGTHALDNARDRVRLAHRSAFWTPLRQWIAVVIAVHSIVIVLMGKTLLNALTSDTSGISAILVACYSVALGRSFWDVRYVSSQTLKARRQVLTLVEGGRIKTLLEQCEDSLMRDHVTNLYEISRRSSEVSQDNLVVLMQSKLHARIRLTEIAGSVLVTIGLVGTIVGLIASFAGIDVVLESVGEDKQKLLSGFTDTLGGMGTAFYTTLLGSIFGGVVMRVLNTIVVSSTDSLISRIAELTEVYILPTLRTTAKRRAQ